MEEILLKNIRNGSFGSLIVTALFVVVPTVGASPTDCLDLQEDAAFGPVDSIVCLIEEAGALIEGACDQFDSVTVEAYAYAGKSKAASAYCGGPGVGDLVAMCATQNGESCSDTGSTTRGHLFCDARDDADGQASCSAA